jgi:DNA-binding NarL/FixJ family response regulator
MVVDDHVVFTDGLVRILAERFDVVGTVADGSQVLAAAVRLQPQVIVMDVSMPTVSGLEALRTLKAEGHEAKVIILTMHADAKLAVEAFRMGARGYVLKQSSSDELITAIDAVLNGHKYLAASLTEGVMALMAAPVEPAAVALNPRQKEVLRQIVDGRRVKEIAVSLEVSPRAVENIKHEIMSALQVNSTAQLVRYAIEHRLLSQ